MQGDAHHIAAVATALCELDGIDAGEPVPTGEEQPMHGPEGITIVRKIVKPGWTAREEEAKRLVVAIRAIGLLK